jgi:hypothetical protein
VGIAPPLNGDLSAYVRRGRIFFTGAVLAAFLGFDARADSAGRGDGFSPRSINSRIASLRVDPYSAAHLSTSARIAGGNRTATVGSTPVAGLPGRLFPEFTFAETVDFFIVFVYVNCRPIASANSL